MHWKSVENGRAAARFKCNHCGKLKPNIGRCGYCGLRNVISGRPRKNLLPEIKPDGHRGTGSSFAIDANKASRMRGGLPSGTKGSIIFLG